MAQFHWDPAGYLELMRQEVPDYERLQAESAAASECDAKRVLELGTGTGETARRVLATNPRALLIGIDASSGMLAHARTVLPAERVQLNVGRLEDPLPAGPFDLVVTVLSVHHLERPEKEELFMRVGEALAANGRFVLGDVVVPENPADAVTPLDPGYDTPSTVSDQLRWLERAGLRAHVSWAHRDLAVLVADVYKAAGSES